MPHCALNVTKVEWGWSMDRHESERHKTTFSAFVGQVPHYALDYASRYGVNNNGIGWRA